MRKEKRVPEGQLVSRMKWHGNTVTNDAHTLKSKGIKSPAFDDMYAMAKNPALRTEKWFRTLKRLDLFREETPDIHNWEITIIKSTQ